MKYPFFAPFLLTILAGCATSKLQDQSSRGRIAFTQVEKLAFKELHQDEAIRVVGRPDVIKPFDEEKELWTYLESEAENSSQKTPRLNLVVDHETKTLTSVVWIPRNGEPLSLEKDVLAHFSGTSFVRKTQGWVADTYSGDKTYSNRSKGISFYVTEARNEVELISFSLPEERTPATK